MPAKSTTASRPTTLGTQGLSIELRPSDTRVPSWGGEVFIRADVIAPAAAGEARDAERIVLFVDGADDAVALSETVLGQLAVAITLLSSTPSARG